MEIKIQANALDRAIGFFSPNWALKRIRDRTALHATLKYEAAGHGRRIGNWHATGASSNAELRGVLETIRNRSRDLARNNLYGRRAVRSGSNYIVGSGIQAAWKSKGCGGKKRAKKIQALWEKWAEDSKMIDAAGRHNIVGLSGLAARTIIESGECLAIKRYDTSQSFPLQIQLLEPDYIDSSKDLSIAEKDRRILHGIEIDATTAKRLAYWLYTSHPGEGFGYSKSIRVPVANIIHAYLEERPGQIRGVPWLAVCVLRLKDLDDYEDAQLIRQKIAACFSAFLIDPNGEPQVQQDVYSRLEPGTVEVLPNGKDIRFSDPPGAEGYSEYTRQVLRGIAAGFGVPYETLTGDYSQVNFSAGRMARGEFWQELDVWQWQMFIPLFLDPIAEWFLETAQALGYDTSGCSVEWVPPRRQLVDPTREIPAIVTSIRSGLTSRSQSVRELGFDPYEVEQEIAEDNKRADELGLAFDSDGRRIVKPVVEDSKKDTKDED